MAPAKFLRAPAFPMTPAKFPRAPAAFPMTPAFASFISIPDETVRSNPIHPEPHGNRLNHVAHPLPLQNEHTESPMTAQASYRGTPHRKGEHHGNSG